MPGCPIRTIEGTVYYVHYQFDFLDKAVPRHLACRSKNHKMSGPYHTMDEAMKILQLFSQVQDCWYENPEYEASQTKLSALAVNPLSRRWAEYAVSEDASGRVLADVTSTLNQQSSQQPSFHMGDAAADVVGDDDIIDSPPVLTWRIPQPTPGWEKKTGIIYRLSAAGEEDDAYHEFAIEKVVDGKEPCGAGDFRDPKYQKIRADWLAYSHVEQYWLHSFTVSSGNQKGEFDLCGPFKCGEVKIAVEHMMEVLELDILLDKSASPPRNGQLFAGVDPTGAKYVIEVEAIQAGHVPEKWTH